MADNSSMNLSQSFRIYNSMSKEFFLIVKALENATHTQDTAIDITLSLLIQCVEGYMKNRLSKKFDNKIKKAIIKALTDALDNLDLVKKVSTKNYLKKLLGYINKPNRDDSLSKNIKESIRSLLGHINDPSLADCLKEAFNKNELTRMIIRRQIENGQFKDFIKKSKGTRNQIAHMSPSEVKFEDANEILIRYNKFRKLWTAGSKKREDKAAAVW